MERDVVTTSQAAKLLGISVRTAQLLVESGALTSWKTPGGHRRVYRADVMALMKQPNQPPAVSSAVVVLAAPDRLPLYEDILSTVRECSAELHSEVYQASFAIGARLPAAVIVDLNEDGGERLAFVRSLESDPAIGHARVIVVGGDDDASDGAAGPKRIPSPQLVPDALRAVLACATKSSAIDGPLPFPIAANEAQRLIALQRSGLVDTAAEKSFDRVTWLASHVLGTPISLMTLLTPSRQWFKSRQGLDMVETPRSWAFCNQTILQRDVFAVENLALDRRFADNPAVAGDPHFRFYAGAPVLDPNGFALGSVCVIDYEPRRLDRDQTESLRALAALASDQVRLRANDRELRWAQNELSRARKH
ncbi:GAF domain-containing protein [Rhodopseudomonas palustris]|uniref:Putative GAF sensor protein n=1 Tax=Rhodopseudomonas palustris (strain BisB18) TaxID=316056 RepID=Q215A6_RHOPB